MPWGLLFLYGGALSLSHALKTTQAVNFLATGLISYLGQHPILIMISLLVMVIFISNLMSNSAATAVILPIALAVPTLIGIGLSSRLLTYLIAMGSAMAFMLPIATPSATIAYSSGYIDIKDLAKAGILLSIVSIITFVTFGFSWWKLVGVW